MAVTTAASSTTSAVVLAEGNDRKAVILCNTDANACYALFDRGTASASNLSVSIAANDSIQVPKEFVNCAISAVWAADGSGSLFITTRS
jgi:hypothetical protein